MTDEPRSEDEFERGRRAGWREGYEEALRQWRTGSSPFAGVPELPLVTRGAAYVFERSFVDSCIAYEHAVLETIRDVQHARWRVDRDRRRTLGQLAEQQQDAAALSTELAALPPLRRWWLRRTRRWAEELGRMRGRLEEQDRRAELLSALQREIEHGELYRVRIAVDAELAEGRGRRCVVDAMRSGPNRPDGVPELTDVRLFVAGDARRALPDWPRRIDAGGADYGYSWRLENPLRRWETTRWRVSWLCAGDPTHEVYAIERLPAQDGGGPRTGRVWLLGRIEDGATMDATVGELERYAQHERNSLVAVAAAVRRATLDGR